MILEHLFDIVGRVPGRRDDGSVKVDLNRVGHECRARWRHIDDLAPVRVWVSVGVLDDGRWFVDVYGDVSERARAYPDKQTVWDAARGWMTARGGRWERIACYPAARAG